MAVTPDEMRKAIRIIKDYCDEFNQTLAQSDRVEGIEIKWALDDGEYIEAIESHITNLESAFDGLMRIRRDRSA